MFFALDSMVQWLITYKYLVFFPMMVFEGPIISIIAGFLVSLGYLNVFLVFVLAILGDLVGDSIYYVLGRFGRVGIIAKFATRVGVTQSRVDRLERHFKDHPGKTLLVGKLAHGLGAGFLMAAGAARMPFWPFIWYNLLGTIPKSMILLFIGFFMGGAYARVNGAFDVVAMAMFVIAVILGIIYVVLQRRIKPYEEHAH